MLWNTKWDKKPNPLSLDTLIGWLREQEPELAYEYTNGNSCLLALYFTAQGFADPGLTTKDVLHGKHWMTRTRVPLPPNFDYIAHGSEREAQWTFGAALKRAEGIKEAVPV